MKSMPGRRSDHRFTRILALVIAGFLVIGVIIAALFPLMAGAEEARVSEISVDEPWG